MWAHLTLFALPILVKKLSFKGTLLVKKNKDSLFTDRELESGTADERGDFYSLLSNKSKLIASRLATSRLTPLTNVMYRPPFVVVAHSFRIMLSEKSMLCRLVCRVVYVASRRVSDIYFDNKSTVSEGDKLSF